MFVSGYVDSEQQQADDANLVYRQYAVTRTPSDDDVIFGSRHHGGGSNDVATHMYSASVTLTARMAPGGGGVVYGDDDTDIHTPDSRWDFEGGGGSGGSGWWRVASERLPLVVGVFCGGFLVTLLLLALVLYRCCIMPRNHKNYYVRKEEDPQSCQVPQPSFSGGVPPPHPHFSGQQQHPQQTAVFADPKRGAWTYNSRIVAPGPQSGPMHVPWPCSSAGVSRGPLQSPQTSGPGWIQQAQYVAWTTHQQKPPGGILKRGSVSGLEGRVTVSLAPADTMGTVPRSSSHTGVTSGGIGNSVHEKRPPRPLSQPPVSCGDRETNNATNRQSMPQICEFSAHSIANHNQYLSSSILDEVSTKYDEDGSPVEVSTLKTRSLPAWVRSKPRPLSTEDDLAELYAKVNFSKKRKNRMRNDEAAIIALSKSQFLHSNTKDTDTLVDNEAVIVYDERTAL